MTREIKFRAWSKSSKSFINDDEYLIGLDGKFYQMSYISGNYWEEGSLVWNELKNIVLSQFTGLKDKNGKEIYESDIVRLWANPADYNGYEGHNYKGIIEWDDFSLGFILSDGHGLRDFNNIEILGNIFENPELLEVEND